MKHFSAYPGKIIVFLVFIFLVNTALAQERTITGTVTSADDGSTLPGVSIVVKGTTIGTITNMDGEYKITVSSQATTLVYSFI